MCRLLAISFGVLLCSMGFAAERSIRLLTYHIHPPFISAPQQGVTYDLAARLNEALQGEYRFVVEERPRSRVNLELQSWIDGDCTLNQDICSQDWALLWVNPKWGFGASPQTSFQWITLFEDSNSIISLRSTPIEYTSPESLRGLRLAGIRGHKYVGIDDLVAQGEIKRFDGSKERDNLLRLLHGRVDATLLPTSTINYYLASDPSIKPHAHAFYVAPGKHQRYTRHIMLPGSNSALADRLKALEIQQLISMDRADHARVE